MPDSHRVDQVRQGTVCRVMNPSNPGEKALILEVEKDQRHIASDFTKLLFLDRWSGGVVEWWLGGVSGTSLVMVEVLYFTTCSRSIRTETTTSLAEKKKTDDHRPFAISVSLPPLYPFDAFRLKLRKIVTANSLWAVQARVSWLRRGCTMCVQESFRKIDAPNQKFE